ncbi:MAG: AAA family ATPase, partial [Dactylosporangium sp.]|nr:AAA family ATPase [Dactylosporangium sp.]
LQEVEQRLEMVRKEKEAAVQSQEFEKAAALRDQEQKIQHELETERQRWQQSQVTEHLDIEAQDVAQIVADWTGIPVTQLTQEESERFLKLEDVLHERVIAQADAVAAVARAIRRAHAGLKDPRRPIGSFIFLGPTGVGKTELGKALAEALFGDEDASITIDMSEYTERHTVSRLVGAPPGYVGYDEGGQLTEAVRRKPYSVVILDEIEKAHPEIFNLLLQVLEEGRLTEAKGRTVDFRNTVLVMTSNVGADVIRRQTQLGFRAQEDETGDYESMKRKIMEQVRHTFRPEFLNRVDDIIVFHSLHKEHLKKIVELLFGRLSKRLSEQGFHLRATERAKEIVVDEGTDVEYGARPLRRAVTRLVEDPLAEEVLAGRFK